MAGLLDFNDPSQAGLLAFAANMFNAGGASSRPIGLGQALASGIGGMQQAQQQAELLARQKQEQEMQMKMQQMKVQQFEQAMRDQEAAKQQAALIPQIVAKFGDDYQGMIRAGLDPKFVKDLAESRNYGRDEVARVEEISGANGEKLKQQFDKYGQKVGDALNGYVAPQLVDNGASQQFVLPQVGSVFKKTLSPSESAAIVDRRRGLAIQEAQAFEPKWNNEVGKFIAPPSKEFPNGRAIDLAGYQKEPKPLTEAQGKAVAFSARMIDADKQIDSLVNSGVKTTDLTKKTLEGVPLIGNGLGAAFNPLVSPKQQLMEQSQRDFLNAILRQESGASISPSEFDNAAKQYFPQFGDSPEVIAQKAKNRKIAIEGMRAQAGAGANQLQSILNRSPSTLNQSGSGSWSIQKVD